MEPRSKSSCFFTSKVCVSVVTLCLLLTLPQFTIADVVWIKGEDQPTFGRIISKNETGIRFQVYLQDKPTNVVNLKLGSIVQVIKNFDETRLETLSPEDVAAYRGYAEELIPQKQDPVARQLAQRLLLIAAFHSDGSFRVICLKHMIELTESTTERNRLAMLLKVYSPNEKMQIEEAKASSVEIRGSVSDQIAMLSLLRNIRQGKTSAARTALNSVKSKRIIEKWAAQISYDELSTISRANRISKSQLAKLLQVELAILKVAASEDKNAGQTSNTETKSSWIDDAVEVTRAIPEIPNLETVTVFNPKHSVYRDGQWVEPDQP